MRSFSPDHGLLLDGFAVASLVKCLCSADDDRRLARSGHEVLSPQLRPVMPNVADSGLRYHPRAPADAMPCATPRCRSLSASRVAALHQDSGDTRSRAIHVNVRYGGSFIADDEGVLATAHRLQLPAEVVQRYGEVGTEGRGVGFGQLAVELGGFLLGTGRPRGDRPLPVECRGCSTQRRGRGGRWRGWPRLAPGKAGRLPAQGQGVLAATHCFEPNADVVQPRSEVGAVGGGVGRGQLPVKLGGFLH